MIKRDLPTDSNKSSGSLHQHEHPMHIEARTQINNVNLIGAHLSAVTRISRQSDQGNAKVEIQKNQSRRPKIGETRTISLVAGTLQRDESSNTLPNQMSIHFRLWKHKTAQEANKLRLPVDISIRAVSEDLRRQVFTPQRPGNLVDRQHAELLQPCLNEGCRAIFKRDQAEGEQIYWLRMRLRSNKSQHVCGAQPRHFNRQSFFMRRPRAAPRMT